MLALRAKGLLRELFTPMIKNPGAELTDPPTRPLVKVLIKMAVGNHQPVSAELRLRNQQSGFLGPVKPPREST